MKIRKTDDSRVNEMLEYLHADFSPDGSELRLEEDNEFNGLEIKKRNNTVFIKYSQLSFLFRGLGIAKENENKETYCIKESSRFDMNGIMIDCSRNAVLSIDTLKEIIKQLALMGHNTLMLYTEDTYEIEGEPYFGYMRGRYSIEELQSIDRYAMGLGITVIPCIQTLAHLNAAINWSMYRDLTDVNDILLIDDEKTYDFIDKAIRACRKAFHSGRIHIGMDEAHMVGRGKYLDLHGNVDKTELMKRHLEKVYTICEKYDFRPMLWGDMFFRVANHGEYYARGMDYSNFQKCVPDNIDLVYWDYYSKEETEYVDLIRAHKKIADNVLFAGGAWKWTGFAPSLFHSLRVSRYALKACYENGVKEVYTTLWGDNGNEASVFSVLPVIQLFAECGFYQEVTDEHLSRRFKTCTGGNLEDFALLDLPDFPGGKHGRADADPSKYLLYQDCMLGLFDRHVEDGYDRYYAKTAKTLHDAAGRNEKYRCQFETLACLCDVLKNKSEVGARIKNAYDHHDTGELKRIADEILPEILSDAEKFRNALERQWMRENKPQGFEVLDIRLGGVIQRTKSAIGRLHSYLNHEVSKLEELESERLSFDGSVGEEVIGGHSWTRIVSASVV